MILILYLKSYPDIALCEEPLKKWHLEFASHSRDYLTFLSLLLSFLIVNSLILQNTFWSYKILVSQPLIEKCIF